jgi:glycosyltransferase involved in cell wall biosynthesis
MRQKTVLFVGTMPTWQATTGGGELGNARTVETYRAMGLTVLVVPRPRRQDGLIGLASFVLQTSASVLRVLGGLRSRRIIALHISGFYGPVLPVEFLVAMCARISGVPYIYEARGGLAGRKYTAGSCGYRWLFKQILIRAAYRFVQLPGDLALVDRLGGRSQLLPNHVDAAKVTVAQSAFARRRAFDPGHPRLMYFGRIDMSKGVAEMVASITMLRQNGIAATLDIVGDGDANLLRRCRFQAESAPELADAIRFHGRVDFVRIAALASECDLFLFPTRFEGHSNALNEAMLLGLVPVATDVGANAFVIGGIVPLLQADVDARGLANLVTELVRRDVQALSVQSHQRILRTFTGPAVMQSLVAGLISCRHRRGVTV